MRGTKTQLTPGVWRLRVYAWRRLDTGSPIQVSRAFRGGSRDADSALAALVTEVTEGRRAANGHAQPERTVGQLLDTWLSHIEQDRSPTTKREYRRSDGKGRPAQVRRHRVEGVMGV